MREEPELLDCCAVLGRPAIPVGRPYLSPEELLAEMDRLGIAECWCADYRALQNSPAEGNRLLCEQLAGHRRLHPVWVVLPPATAETPRPEDLPAAMAAAGVGLVRAEPDLHGWSLAERSSRDLWAALEDCRVPVLLDAGGHWDALDRMLSAHPRLPVILTGLGYRADRELFPLLAAHPALHVEISGCLANEGLIELSRRFGVGRMLFGTDSPRVAPEAALGTLRFSGLSATELRAVAGDNLRALLAGAGTPSEGAAR